MRFAAIVQPNKTISATAIHSHHHNAAAPTRGSWKQADAAADAALRSFSLAPAPLPPQSMNPFISLMPFQSCHVAGIVFTLVNRSQRGGREAGEKEWRKQLQVSPYGRYVFLSSNATRDRQNEGPGGNAALLSVTSSSPSPNGEGVGATFPVSRSTTPPRCSF